MALVVLVSMMSVASGAWAQAHATTEAKPDPEATPLLEHPGYVAFATDGLFSKRAIKVHISIKDAMLRLVAAATRESEPDLAAMIGGLRAIEVVVYRVDEGEGRDRVHEVIETTAARLKNAGWEPAIDIRLEGSGGFLYFRFGSGEHPVGLAGIFLDGAECVFLNIVGTIDPELLGRLATRFNISLLEELGTALPATPAQRGQ